MGGRVGNGILHLCEQGIWITEYHLVTETHSHILYTKAYKKKKSIIMHTQDYKDLNEEHNPFSCPASPFPLLIFICLPFSLTLKKAPVWQFEGDTSCVLSCGLHLLKLNQLEKRFFGIKESPPNK